MVNKTHTTETLRQTLFETIEGVLADEISTKQGGVVADLAGQVIKTADLEMRYTKHLVGLDNEKTNPDDKQAGKMVLAIATGGE